MKIRNWQTKLFNIFPSRAGRVMLVYQPKILSSITRPNSTDEFNITQLKNIVSHNLK